MIKKNTVILLLLLSTGAFAQSTGWKNLFDGKTLKGWHQLNGKAKYTVANGVITGTTVTGEPNSFLATDENYGKHAAIDVLPKSRKLLMGSARRFN